MAKISKAKYRWLRTYYSTYLAPLFYVDRQGRPCLATRGQVLVNVKLQGPVDELNPPRVEPQTFTIDFTGF